MLLESSSVAAKHGGKHGEMEAGEKPRYRLVSRIAVGSTAELFLAVMPGACDAAKPVVIKMLWPELARDDECVSQFLDEARLSLQLHHPNVLHCYESGFDGARYFLTMEYLDGQSLKHLLDKLGPEGGLSLPLSLKIISDVLAGLEYAHTLTDLHGTPLRVVHRDVSPQNVLVTYDGAVKLVDFGIAQTAITMDRTRRTGIEGRLAYMAPEQAAGQAIDHRADLFSVGVMLWEAVMGRRLWQGLSDEAIRERLLSGRPIPRLPNTRGFPPGLAAICDHALALEPSSRYSCASDFQADLSMVLTGSAPVQSRLIGEMVSRLFASERSLIRTMMKQSLPTPSSRRISGSQPLVGDDASEPEGTVLYDRHASGSISMLGEDVTLVNALPLPSDKRNRRALRAVGVFVVAVVFAGGLGLARHLARPSTTPPRSLTVAEVAKPPQPQPASAPSVATNFIAATEVPTSRSDVERRIPAPPSSRYLPKRNVPNPSKQPQKAESIAANPPAALPPEKAAKEPISKGPSAGEAWELSAKKPPLATRRPIDRNNPYGP